MYTGRSAILNLCNTAVSAEHSCAIPPSTQVGVGRGFRLESSRGKRYARARPRNLCMTAVSAAEQPAGPQQCRRQRSDLFPRLRPCSRVHTSTQVTRVRVRLKTEPVSTTAERLDLRACPAYKKAGARGGLASSVATKIKQNPHFSSPQI